MSNLIKIKEQEEILNSFGKNIIVSASAGSGKTTIMIKKAINYVIEKKCHVDELLVLTYTKASAMEMKKKLIESLKQNQKDYPFLEDELELVAQMDICTIDSFCQKLIKKYFYLLNIDPSFNILQGSELTLLQSQALDSALNIIKKEETEVYENLINNFSDKRDETKIKKLALQIYNYSTSILNKEDFYNNTLSLYEQNNLTAEKYLNNHYNIVLSGVKDNLSQLLERCDNLKIEGYCKYINNLLSIVESLILSDTISKKLNIISASNFGIFRTIKTVDEELSENIKLEKERISKLKTEFIKQFVSGENVEISYKNCEKLVKNLIKLVKNFEICYKNLKNESNLYDFDDIERLAITLLENDDARQEISDLYKYIFVDEYQDANKIQEKIIYQIAKNNLFFVGDVKQSIYAFRQSDPEIFINTEKEFSNNKTCESKRLNCNFRTNKNILDFANYVFSTVMTSGSAGLDYKEKAQFDARAVYKTIQDEINVSINLINKDENDKEIQIPTHVYSVKENSLENESTNKYSDECTLVCSKILECLGQKIYEKSTDTFKDVSFSDITILLAKRGEFLNCLVQKMETLKIPYVVNLNDNLDEVYDNMVLYNLLKYTYNNYDDYALYGVLNSQLFGFSDEELAIIKSESNEKYLIDAITSCENKDFKEKLKNFINFTLEFESNIKNKGIYYALGDILDKTDYLLKISSDTNFKQRRLNIDAYIESFLKGKFNYDLSAYLLFRETCALEQKVITEKNFTDAVEITTMHASKGLEYPIVILPNLSYDITKEHDKSSLAINKDLGMGIKHYSEEDREIVNGIFYSATKLANKKQELSEKIRLLYVAMTRAKNKLIITAENLNNYKQIKNDGDIFACNNFISMILGCFDRKILDKINNNVEFETNLFNNDTINLSCFNLKVTPLKAKRTILKQQEMQNLESVQKFLDIDIKQNVSQIALKNSVSKFAFDDESSFNPTPKTFETKEHTVSNVTDAGIIYHELLEKIDFNNVNKINDVEMFIRCNFDDDKAIVLKSIGYENIFNIISSIKVLIKDSQKLLKEQKFIMNVPYNQIVESSITDKILVQGIMDLVVIKDNTAILIDYKYTSKSPEQILDTYSKQLSLYKMALKNLGTFKNIKCHIINIKNGNVIDVN